MSSGELPSLRKDDLVGMRQSCRHGSAERPGEPMVRRQTLQQRDRRCCAASAQLDVLEEERLTVMQTTGRAARLRALLTATVLPLTATTGVASGDATDDYPIPNRILHTACSAEQILAAVRDVRPVYYERYMIDFDNKTPDVQQAARDRIHWFFSMDYAGRRQYSENIATDIYYEQMAFRWPNWAKIFFNNKGVAARATDVCHEYPDDPGVWRW